jgi:hypothetical protein
MWRQIDDGRVRHATCDILGERGWSLADDETPPLAAHLVTVRRGYTHHGIYVGDGKVVHYAGLSRSWRSGPVEEITLAEFACGRAIRVRPCSNPRFDAREVVARARSRLGEHRYRVLSNNCEHFCEWCLRGTSRSLQVERLRNRPRLFVLAALQVIATPFAVLREAISNLHAWSDNAPA